MRKLRFYVADKLNADTTLNLDQETSHYISRVLRLTANAQIFLFNNSGNEYLAEITHLDRNVVKVKILSTININYESPLEIHLGQVLAKGEKMDLVIQKATELGIKSITPLYSERTVIKKVADRTEHKLDHWQKVATAASTQCWRNIVPVINEPQALTNWITKQQNSKLILHPMNNVQRLRDLNITSPVTILIGPEGGFSDEELTLAINHQFIPISFGPRILRTETAGLATIASLQAIFGDC